MKERRSKMGDKGIKRQNENRKKLMIYSGREKDVEDKEEEQRKHEEEAWKENK